MWHLPSWPPWDGVVGMDLTAALSDLCKGIQQPIIAIDGPAGAGKTTLASDISISMGRFMKVHTLHMDSLYNGWLTPFDEKWSASLITAVRSHKAREKYSLPNFDWQQSTYTSPIEQPGAELLILEGVGAGFSQISSDITALIWMDIDPSLGLQRVLTRDGEEISAEMQNWLHLQEQHFLADGTKIRADFILTT